MASAPDACPDPARLASTGVEGLDDVLGGGLTPNQLYLIEGVPGRARRPWRSSS